MDRYVTNFNEKNKSVINVICDIPCQEEGKCSFSSKQNMDIVYVVGGMAGLRGGVRASPCAALKELTLLAIPRLSYKSSFARQLEDLTHIYFSKSQGTFVDLDSLFQVH